MPPVRRAWIGALLVVAWLLLYVGLGGRRLEAQLLAHLVMLLSTLACLWLPDPTLRKMQRLGPLWVGMSLLGAAIIIGLIPLPARVLGWVAPGIINVHGPTWHTLSTSPEETASRLSLWVLFLGMGTAAGIWATRRGSIERSGRVGVMWFCFVLLFAVAHAWFGIDEVLGVIATPLGHHRPLFAPFVNDTHLATMLLLLLPIAAVQMRSPHSAAAWVSVVVSVCIFAGAFAQIASRGATLALLAMAGIAWASGDRRRQLWSATALFALGAPTLWAGWNGYLTDIGRLRAWRDAVPILWEHPLSGTGHGGFEMTFAAHRTNLEFLRWSHLHNDGLQWVVEGGAIGLVLGGLALFLLVPPAAFKGDALPWLVGCIGVMLHSLVEFPFHLPSLAASVVVVIGLVHGSRSGTRFAEWPVSRVRVVARVLVFLQLGATIWSGRSLIQDRAVRDVESWSLNEPAAERAADVLRLIAPWRAEIRMLEIWEAEASGETARAASLSQQVVKRYRADDTVLRRAALALMRCGELDAAREALETSIAQNPADWRSPVILARLNERVGADTALEDWSRALRRGAPVEYLDEAWRVMPEGIVWLDALAGSADPARFSSAWGALLLQKGQPGAALLAFEQAALIGPSTGHAYNPNYLRLLARDGRHREALRRTGLGLDAGTQRGVFLTIRGDLLYDLDQVNAAFNAYQAAVASSPEAAENYIERAASSRGIVDAEQRYRALILAYGPNPWGALALASAYRDSGDVQSCRALIRRVSRQDSDLFDDDRVRKLNAQCRDFPDEPIVDEGSKGSAH